MADEKTNEHVEQVVEVQQKRIQQQMVEQIVEVPVPMTQEEIGNTTEDGMGTRRHRCESCGCRLARQPIKVFKENGYTRFFSCMACWRAKSTQCSSHCACLVCRAKQGGG